MMKTTLHSLIAAALLSATSLAAVPATAQQGVGSADVGAVERAPVKPLRPASKAAAPSEVPEAAAKPMAAAKPAATARPATTAKPATTSAEQPPAMAAGGPQEALALAIANLDQTRMSFVEKRRLAAVAEFYKQRGNEPAWVVDGFVTDKARAVVARLSAADEDGLEPAALGIPVLAEAGVGLDASETAVLELALSRAVVAFAEEASAGRVDPARIDKKNITRKPEHIDPIAALTAVSGGGDVAATLEGFNPPHEGFRRLKAELAKARARGVEERPEPIEAGKTLKPGMVDQRVPVLRARLDLPEAGDPLGAELYDDGLVEAVKVFQRKSGLLDDGIIGSRTLAVLNGEDRDQEGEILANMEMWRWMPRDLGRDHVLVNIPEFMVRIVRDGAVTHEARVVVGTPKNQTPVFSDEMEYMVVNPYWHVPESIKTKEFLPEIQADPASFFRRHGYEVTWNGEVIDPNSVIWDENAVKAVGIRQPPGEVNALGRIKFMFPNKHAVYLHDTPSRKLFDRDYRAYSHGCVRVHEPLAFADAILKGEPVWDAEKIKSMFGGDERRVDLEQHIRVHIAYFNVWVDDTGTLQMRDDLYGHSAKIKAALRS